MYESVRLKVDHLMGPRCPLTAAGLPTPENQTLERPPQGGGDCSRPWRRHVSGRAAAATRSTGRVSFRAVFHRPGPAESLHPRSHPPVESRSSDMGMISNARAKSESTFVASLVARQQRE